MTVLDDYKPSDFGLTSFSDFRQIQREAIEYASMSEKRFKGLALPQGCHAPGQGILMADGSSRRVEDVHVGDSVMGWKSSPQGVESTHSGYEEMFRVVPNKGRSFIVNKWHMLTLFHSPEGGPYPSQGPYTLDVELPRYLKQGKFFKLHHLLFRMPCQRTFRRRTRRLIDPYILGVLLGDGSIQHGVMVTAVDREVREAVLEFAAKCQLDVRLYEDNIYLVTPKHSRGYANTNPVTMELRRLGLFGTICDDKFVPDEYRFGSVDDRLEMIAGLIDTDGALARTGYDFVSKSRHLAEDMAFLCRSVGLAAYINPCEKTCQTGNGGIYYRVSISGHTDDIPCRIARKKAPARRQIKNVLRTGFTVEPLGKGEYFGFTLEGDGRFLLDDFTVVHNSGKSLMAIALARMSGLRTAILTATKGLQQQYCDLYSRYGLLDIRGRQNYPCLDYAHLDCQGGMTMGCGFTKGNGCSYEKVKAAAKEAQIVVTNYAFWMAVHDKAMGIERATEDEIQKKGENPFELLILDEGHDAPDKLASYISCRILEKDLKIFGDYPMGEKLDEWSLFAKKALPELAKELRTAGMELAHLQKKHGRKVPKEAVDRFHRLQALESKLTRIGGASGDDWIVEKEEGTRWGRMWKFDSVFPGKYAESYLFCGVPNVLVMSATLKPKTLHLLGLKKEAFDFKAWRRIFSANRNPIYMVGMPDKTADGKPTTLRIDRGTSKDKLLDWVKWHDDEIIGPRLDRNGLIQTVSYDRALLFLDNSRYNDRMIGNTADPDSETALEAAETFRKAKRGAILVSPSFSTGYDFAGKTCEYVILCKVPFESRGSKVLQARCKRDEYYADYRAAQVTEQSMFRGMRFEDDQCECFATDGHFAWFLSKAHNLSLTQDWFYGAVRRMAKVPKPMRRLQ